MNIGMKIACKDSKIAIINKKDIAIKNTTRRNSRVLYVGFYYSINSLKVKFTMV